MRHVRDVYFTDAGSAVAFVYFAMVGFMGLFMLLAIPVVPVSMSAAGMPFHPSDAVVLVIDMAAGLASCLVFLAYTGACERMWRDAADADCAVRTGDATVHDARLHDCLVEIGVPVRAPSRTDGPGAGAGPDPAGMAR